MDRAPEASETSCSEERPPASTIDVERAAGRPFGCAAHRVSPTRTGPGVVGVDVVVSAWSGVVGVPSVPTAIVTVEPFADLGARRGALAQDDPDLRLFGGRRWYRLRLQRGFSERRVRRALRFCR